VADSRSAGWSQAGLGLGAVAFIADHEIAAVGADNSSVEAIPFDRGVFMGLHLALLRGLGVTLLEHLWLAELSADRCYEMLLSVGGLPVRGATGSPVNPIAIG
jgi:kynurenine formamidase